MTEVIYVVTGTGEKGEGWACHTLASSFYQSPEVPTASKVLKMPSTLTTPGTIAEYDVVLSISEEAINRQFELLYKTPVDKLALPPPPGMEERGAAPPPPSKYLINHDLEIHIAAPMPGGKSDIDYDEGIFGHIKPPRVSFKESGSENKARVTLEFERVESFNDEDKKDSIFAQWVGRGPNAKIESTTINGWTMSWDVRLGQTNIQDIMTGECVCQ